MFRVGDTVRCLKDYPGQFTKGQYYTITGININQLEMLDDYNCTNGWLKEYFELVEVKNMTTKQPFEVGEIIRCKDISKNSNPYSKFTKDSGCYIDGEYQVKRIKFDAVHKCWIIIVNPMPGTKDVPDYYWLQCEHFEKLSDNNSNFKTKVINTKTYKISILTRKNDNWIHKNKLKQLIKQCNKRFTYSIDGIRKDIQILKEAKYSAITVYHKNTKQVRTFNTSEETINFATIKNLMLDIKNDIRSKRKAKKPKENPISWYELDGDEYEVKASLLASGRFKIMTIPGQIVKIAEQRKAKEIFRNKKPMENDNYIGIELEFISKLNRQELGLMLFNNGMASCCALKSDGSVSPEGDYKHPHEINLLVKESELTEKVTKLCNLLAETCAVNKTCGMHVHIDVRNRNAEKVFENLVSCQNMLYSINPASRRENEYCKPTRFKELSKRTGNRYLGINPESYREHCSIECRIHSGTIEANKIINWVNILVSAANYQGKIRSVRTPKTFSKMLGLNTETTEYIKARFAKFKQDTESSALSEQDTQVA